MDFITKQTKATTHKFLIVNGKPVNSLDELPDEVRRELEKSVPDFSASFNTDAKDGLSVDWGHHKDPNSDVLIDLANSLIKLSGSNQEPLVARPQRPPETRISYVVTSQSPLGALVAAGLAALAYYYFGMVGH